MRRLFVCLFCVWTLSLAASAQEFPFVYYPGKLGGRGKVLAFQQNSNKEIVWVSREGVFAFNSKSVKKAFDFSQEQISGVKQAVFTSRGLAVLANEGLLAIDLKKGEAEVLKKEGGDQVFYNAGKEEWYLKGENALDWLTDNGKLTKVVVRPDEIKHLFFNDESIFLIEESNVRVYSNAWDLKEVVKVGEPIIDASFKNERLLLLTKEAIWSKEGNAVLKKILSFPQLQLRCIQEDQTGNIWVGTRNSGVLLYDGNQSKVLGLKNNFPLAGVEGIYEGEDFSVWFYGEEGIAVKPFSAPFLEFPLGKELAGESLEDMKKLDADRVGVLTRDGYYHLLENESIQKSIQVDLPFFPAFSRIIADEQSIHVSKKGNILLHNRGSRLRSSLKLDVQNLFTFKDQSILVDKGGVVYSVDHRTAAIRKISWEMATDKLLFETDQSLVYTDLQGKLKRWESESGRHELLGDYSQDMLMGALVEEKHFLFLSKDQQLKYLMDGQVSNLDFRLGEKQKVQSFLSNAGLWISTEDQLYQLRLQLEEQEVKILETKVFTKEEYGLQLPVKECIENVESSYYLASEKGLTLYNVLAMAPDVSPPGIAVEKVFVQRQDSLERVGLFHKDSIRVSLQEQEHLFIHAFPINFGQKSRPKLKYRILPHDQRWKAPWEDGLVLISGLQPGEYVVELASESEQGVESREKIPLTLEVQQASWNNWYFVLGATLGLMLVGFVGYSGLRSVKDANSREAKEKYEKELLKLQRKTHEQMMKADGLKQVNELITAQKAELEDKNKQIIAQKYELFLTSNQIKQQKDLIEKTTEKLQSSINYAQRIQTALMADEIQIKDHLPESFVLFKPRDQVSGDFFWFARINNELGEEVLVIAAVDCTGHGVPGAIVSVVGIQLLNAIVHAKAITDPGSILSELNTDLLNSLKYEQTRINDGMDMSLCTINLERKKVYFAGAKNALYIVEDGELQIIKGDRNPIGGQKLKEEKSYRTHELLLKGEGKQMFYLFTDGYQDQFGGPDNFKFLVKNFKNLLLEISSKSAMEQKYILSKTIKDWQGEWEQTDDILVMGFRI